MRNPPVMIGWESRDSTYRLIAEHVERDPYESVLILSGDPPWQLYAAGYMPENRPSKPPILSHLSGEWDVSPDVSPEFGPVESSVRRDLERLGKLEDGVRASLAAMALRLAQAYDGYDGGDMTKLSRVNQELRQTLAAIVEVGDDGDDGDAAALSTPEWSGVPTAVRDSEVAGAADAGPANGGGGPAAG
jgi:hypothetical protein